MAEGLLSVVRFPIKVHPHRYDLAALKAKRSPWAALRPGRTNARVPATGFEPVCKRCLKPLSLPLDYAGVVYARIRVHNVGAVGNGQGSLSWNSRQLAVTNPMRRKLHHIRPFRE